MVELVVESVSSSSLLRRSLSIGEAKEFGEFDGEILVVDEGKATDLVETYPNVRFSDHEPQVKESETARMEADNDGVSYSDEPDICGTEMTDGSVCERPAGECPYHGGE